MTGPSPPTGPLTLASRVRTSQGLDLPWLGLGVFQSPPGATTRRAVEAALRLGFRLIDTASMYGNEKDVGEAVRASGVPREEVVVTTKLWHTDHGYESALAAAKKSEESLGLGPIDLYLIHWPRAEPPQLRQDSWRALEELREAGRVRAIGVSNYTVRHLRELLEHAKVVPAVNQVEFHPFVYDPELLRYCAEKGIRVEAYSPLTRGRRLDHPLLVGIAKSHRRTPAQVLIRWGLHHGVVEIPKTVHDERLRENAGALEFALEPEEVTALDGLASGDRLSWDPTEIP
jgi:diketogulonate reductase-like aldo/keto reductase